MTLTSKDIIKELAKELPEYSEEQIQEMIYSCWGFFKENMESGILTKMRLKYFGTFIISAKKAEGMLKNMDARLSKGLISQKDYDKYKKSIVEYLERIKDDTEESD